MLRGVRELRGRFARREQARHRPNTSVSPELVAGRPELPVLPRHARSASDRRRPRDRLVNPVPQGRWWSRRDETARNGTWQAARERWWTRVVAGRFAGTRHPGTTRGRAWYGN